MGRRNRQLKGRSKFPCNKKCPCGSELKYKFCHGNTRHTQLCKAAVARKFRDLITAERHTHYFKIWRLLWFLLRPFGVRRSKCPCGSGLRHMYCHGSQKKADTCKEAYTSRMKVCIDEAKARRVVSEGHQYVESEDKQIENSDQKKGQQYGFNRKRRDVPWQDS